ncbi:MAG: FtsX-like permease family protein, partial [Bacteroidota bacterium]
AFGWAVLAYLRPYFWGRKSISFDPINTFDMYRNYLKIAWRNLLHQKLYSVINLVGLAIGMAACLVILLFVRHEISYDRYHEKSDRIYRMTRQWLNKDGESTLHLGHVAPPFGPLVQNDYGNIVRHSVRFLSDQPLMSLGEEVKLVEDRFFFAEAPVFEVFSWPLLEGDPETALAEPNSLVLTQSTARKYFGKESAMGKILNYQGQVDMKVTGIVADLPPNSHFQWNMLASFQTVENFFGRENMMGNWGSNNYATYLLFHKGHEPHELSAQFPKFFDKHLGEWQGIPASTFNRLYLQKLTDIHLYSHLDSEIEANGDIAYVYIFSLIALLVLVIGCINFVNLTTARGMRRAKEVGLRKVLGAHRSSVIRQFLTESVLSALLSVALAVLLVELALPLLNDRVFDNPLIRVDYGEPFFWLLILGITLVVGMLAGAYPAFFLSRFRPVQILRGKVNAGSSRSYLRSTLVVLQFTISISLLVSVGIIQDQLAYVRSKPLGFNQHQLISLPVSDEVYDEYERLRSRLMQHPGIEAITLSSRVPSGRLLDSQGGKAEVAGELVDLNTRVADVHVGHAFLKTFDIPLVAGRDFDVKLASDSNQAFLLNQAAIEAIGWSDAKTAINKEFHYGNREGRVIGVMEDFHFESLHQDIAPIVFMITEGRANFFTVRYYAKAKEEVEQLLEEEWTRLRPDVPFSYTSIEAEFNEQYQNEDRLGELVGSFSLLAVLIATLGLLGLAGYTTEQRFREIGIRRVLGASVREILVLLTSNVSLLVLIALLLSAPLAYFVMDRLWLSTFAYRGPIEWDNFLIAGGHCLADRLADRGLFGLSRSDERSSGSDKE